MNERIKQLAIEAGLSEMPSNYPDMADLYKGADFELERFAELIIKECLNKCIHVENECRENREHKAESSATLIKLLIKQHFGVEE
jgi:hypothetical protein